MYYDFDSGFDVDFDVADILRSSNKTVSVNSNNIGVGHPLLFGSGLLLLFAVGAIVRESVKPTLENFRQRLHAKLFMMYSSTKTKYKWEVRKKCPKCLTAPLDHLFALNDITASVDSPRDIADGIKVVSATLRNEHMCVDVTSQMGECVSIRVGVDDEYAKIGEVMLYMGDLVKVSSSSAAPDTGVDGDWSLDILYLGHAHPLKHVSAQEFGVKYVAKISEGILFPPYNAAETIRKGFKANKVVFARSFDERDLTPLAKKYAGLRANFYQDVDDPQVQKRYIDHTEAHVLLSENGKPPETIVVSSEQISIGIGEVNQIKS